MLAMSLTSFNKSTFIVFRGAAASTVKQWPLYTYLVVANIICAFSFLIWGRSALQSYLKRQESGDKQSGRSPDNPFSRGKQRGTHTSLMTVCSQIHKITAGRLWILGIRDLTLAGNLKPQCIYWSVSISSGDVSLLIIFKFWSIKYK